jgi:hypothetical protein
MVVFNVSSCSDHTKYNYPSYRVQSDRDRKRLPLESARPCTRKLYLTR